MQLSAGGRVVGAGAVSRPPIPTHAERLVVGALLIRPDGAARVNGLRGSMFHDRRLGASFDAIRSRVDAGQEVSGVLVAADVGADEDWQRLLVEVTAECDRPSAAVEAAGLVEEAWRRRRIIAEAARVSTHALEGTDPTASVNLLLTLVGSSVDERPVDLLERRMLVNGSIEDIPPPEWLVRDWFAFPSLAVLYGEPGTGKSVVAQGLALSLVTQTPWLGQPVAGTRVLYIVGEGVAGMGKRQQAWRRHHEVAEIASGLHYLPQAVDLRDPETGPTLAGYCDRHDIGAVVVDTLARCIPGADENKAQDMGLAVQTLDMVKGSSRLVLVVHHTGKVREAGMRGSTAILGAADTTIELVGRRGDPEYLLRMDKQKDSAPADGLRFTLLPVGESVVAEVLGAQDASRALRADSDKLYLMLLDLVMESAEGDQWEAVPSGVLKAAYFDREPASDAKFYRTLKDAKDRELIVKVGRSSWAPKALPSAFRTPEEGDDG